MHQHRQKPGGGRIFLLFLLLLFLLSGSRTGAKYLFSPAKDRAGETRGPVPALTVALEGLPAISAASLHSPAALLVRVEDQRVLLAKNSEKKIYPASLTKIMTALVAIEKLADLQQPILLPAGLFQDLHRANASLAGFLPDEKVAAVDLLYGVLLPSGAECCLGLAEAVAGSERNFVRLMNRQAAQLGMKNTNFTNTTGLHDPNHYTTVEDLSVLLLWALQNDTFREVFTSARHSTGPTNRHPDGITFYNAMFQKMGSPALGKGEILGGKTGYTAQAGLCLASLARQGGQEYILVTAGASGDHRTEQYNITDAFTVYGELGQEEVQRLERR